MLYNIRLSEIISILIFSLFMTVTIMCGLYFQIWRETKKRQKDLPNLQAGGGGMMSSGGGHHQSIKKDASKRSNSRWVLFLQNLFIRLWKVIKNFFISQTKSDETSTVNHQIGEYIDPNFWHPHSGDNESNSYYSGAHPHSIHDLSRRTSVSWFMRVSTPDLIYNQMSFEMILFSYEMNFFFSF